MSHIIPEKGSFVSRNSPVSPPLPLEALGSPVVLPASSAQAPIPSISGGLLPSVSDCSFLFPDIPVSVFPISFYL